MIEWLKRYYVPIDALGVIFAAILTAIAAAGAYVQFTAQWHLENVAAAKSAYNDFMKLSLDNPMLSRPDLVDREFTALEYEKYFWYANIMSQTFERVFQYAPDQEQWNWIAREQFRLHCGFYSGDDYDPELYSERFRELVASTLADIPDSECYVVNFTMPWDEPTRERSPGDGEALEGTGAN